MVDPKRYACGPDRVEAPYVETETEKRRRFQSALAYVRASDPDCPGEPFSPKDPRATWAAVDLYVVADAEAAYLAAHEEIRHATRRGVDAGALAELIDKVFP